MRKKILQEIHPLHLIREVQKWPALYEKDGPERANVHLKHKMWLEVSKALFDDWDSYTKPVRELKVQELTRKWRNLRDTFKRHVELEKRSREEGAGGAERRKRKYVYFKYMLFLLPHMAPAPDAPDEPLPELDAYFARRQQAARPRRRRSANAPPAPRPAPAAHPAPPAPRPAPAAHPAPAPTDIDEDKHFLLSLVPTFKKMSDDEKLMAKMEILRAIRDVRGRGALEEGPAGGEGPVKLEFYCVDDVHSNDSADSDRNSD